MSWAARRRFFILLLVGSFFVALAASALIATVTETPTCADGIQNQDEAGIDCGGSCAYLCLRDQEPPTVLFTQALPASTGRVSVVALVENKNAHAAADDVPYAITLYGPDQTLLATIRGALDLPAGTRVPVFAPNIVVGQKAVTSAFLSIDPSVPRWYAASGNANELAVVNVRLAGTTAAPRIEAALVNRSSERIANVRAVVLVRGEAGRVFAASATIVPDVPAGTQTDLLFTWSAPFGATPLAIEVIPLRDVP